MIQPAEVGMIVLLAIPLVLLGAALFFGFCVALQAVGRSKTERIALAQFKIDYPDMRPGFTRRQRDGDLDIVTISYGPNRPRSTKYYAVERNEVAREIDGAKYRPEMNR